VKPYEVAAKKEKQFEEEMDFFDKVRRRLDNKFAYIEFLRCLNLFSNEIITRQELIQLVYGFLGKYPDLFEWFKRIVGLKDGLGKFNDLVKKNKKVNRHNNDNEIWCSLIERKEKLQERPPEIDYANCKRYGPSYRALPKAYQYMKCTGRDELCNEVLNDVWVSFPTWSEDSVFLSSKKNMYEEALYKCEDEHYEMDRIIEANSATIKVLESIAIKMLDMTTEELGRFHLNNGLNGTSECIYTAAIRRIYGDRANEILGSLKHNPTVTVPLVLQRLKQKDEEWHRVKVRSCKR
jgi:paired amphipathic helix protein Sin3a